jgi:hypothetical protein
MVIFWLNLTQFLKINLVDLKINAQVGKDLILI